jgi:hypothetical protein
LADKEKQASSKQKQIGKMNYELCTMYLSAGAQFFKLQGAVGWLLVRSHSASGPNESLTQSRRALGTTLHREAYASLD